MCFTNVQQVKDLERLIKERESNGLSIERLHGEIAID